MKKKKGWRIKMKLMKKSEEEAEKKRRQYMR
jgi:hypothetical protein